MVTGCLAVEIVDFFEVIQIDQIKDEIAMIRSNPVVAVSVCAQRLTRVGRDGHLKKTSVANSCERILQRSFFEFFVCSRQLSGPVGKGFCSTRLTVLAQSQTGCTAAG